MRMKSLISLLILFVCVSIGHAQTVTDADGSLKLRGNVAIISDGNFYTFQNGQYVKKVDDEVAKTLLNAIHLGAMQAFQNVGFGIVNRNDEANAQVQQLLEENRLEDYINGYSVQAKGQGADWLYVIECNCFELNNMAVQFELSTRLINIENNLSYHFHKRFPAVSLQNPLNYTTNVKLMVRELFENLNKTISQVLPDQYFIAKADGRKLYIGAYQQCGISPEDKFQVFKYTKETEIIRDAEIEIFLLEKIAECTNPSATSTGNLLVKSDKVIPDEILSGQTIVLFRNNPEPKVGSTAIPITFFGLSHGEKNYDDMNKKRINNAIMSAITRNPLTQLVEHDHLSSLKAERELQKGEDFINGHTVHQLKAIGAIWLIKAEGYESDGTNMTFKLCMIDVEANRIVRTVDVSCNIDNLETEIYKYVCERFAYPCVVDVKDNTTLVLTLPFSLTSDNEYKLSYTKSSTNPIDGQTIYTSTPLCKIKLIEYKGNKGLYLITEVINKEDLHRIDEISKSGLLKVEIDTDNIKIDNSTSSDVEKMVKKEKRKQMRKAVVNALLNNITVETNTTPQNKSTQSKSIPTKKSISQKNKPARMF